MSFAAVGAHDDRFRIFGLKIPAGDREWQFFVVSHEPGLDELRGVPGSATATKAYQDEALPFPDGTILTKLAWKHEPLGGIDGAFVTGPATSVQIMVKDSRTYAATGGWEFGRFIDSKSVDQGQLETCFPRSQAYAEGERLRLHALRALRVEHGERRRSVPRGSPQAEKERTPWYS
nr:cytochrome P460 family protein [Limobrevibacterium gyesilva]